MLEARTLQKKHLETINSVDTSQMRPEYAEPLKKIQEQFTPENFNEKTVAKLSELKKELEANPEMALPKSTMDKIGEMDKTPYKDLSVDDLGVIADVFKHYAKLQQESHSINVGIQKVEAKVVAENVIKELPKQKELPPLKTGETRKVGMPTGGDRIKEGFKNAVDTLVITGQEFPDLIGQKIGDTYRKVIVTPVKEGVTKMHAYIVDRATEFRTMTEQVHKNVGNVHGWLSEVDVVNAKNSAGEPTIVDVNKAEMLAMYMHSLNKSNRRHLVEGGFGFRFRGKGMRDVVLKLDEVELKRIQGVVESDSNMKSYVEAAKSVLSKTGKDQATVHLDINDVPLPLEDNYYHIDTMPIGRKKAAEEAISTESKQGVIRVGIDKGQLEARTGAAGPIYINPVTHDLAVSIQHAAAYVNLEKPLINASRLHYNGDVQSKLGAVTGPKTWKVMDKFLKDAAQQVGPKTDLDMMLGKIRNNMATSLMGFPNLFIPFKQPAAWLRYANEVSPGYMLKGLYASIAHPKTSQDFLTRTSDVYKTRRVEGINMAAAEIMQRGQVESQFGGKEGLSQKLMSPISYADTRGSVRPGMMGAYMQALDEMAAKKVRPRTAELIGRDANTLNSLPPDEQIANAIKFAEVVTERYQTSGNPALLNDFQRGETTAKLFSLFQSEGVVGMNMRRRAFVEAQKSKSLGGWARFTKVMAISLLAEPLFETAIDEARRTFNAKESVGSAIRRYPKDVMAKSIQQATSGIPLVRDAAQYITNKKLLGINYQNQGLTPVDNLVNDATVTVGTLLDPSTYRSWHNAYKAAGNMADLAGALSGLPITPLKRTVEGAINIVKKATE
jgi:hypothetical protein